MPPGGLSVAVSQWAVQAFKIPGGSWEEMSALRRA